MTYKITYEPLNRISGVQPKTVEKKTAKEAWDLAYGLMRSDEKVTIKDQYDLELDWQQLKALADREGA